MVVQCAVVVGEVCLWATVNLEIKSCNLCLADAHLVHMSGKGRDSARVGVRVWSKKHRAWVLAVDRVASQRQDALREPHLWLAGPLIGICCDETDVVLVRIGAIREQLCEVNGLLICE